MITNKVKIEELLHSNAPDFEIAKLLRADIKRYFKTLEKSFINLKGRDFLYKHTKAIDTLLKVVYRVAIRSSFGEYTPMKTTLPIVLVALGSYGREQLCVHSDIDLMIVYKETQGYNTQYIIEKILHILWDCGLKLGHRVHVVDELFDVAKKDITIKSSFIESRFIEGSNHLWTEVQNEINIIRHYKQEEFIEAKIEELKRLHRRYPLTMEPNLKDGEGGFRSANLIYWIGNILYNINKIKELPKEIVDENEYRKFHIALDFLFRVRSALHLATNRKQDILIVDLIPQIAKYLGYKDEHKEHVRFAKRVSFNLKIIKLYTSLWIYNLTGKTLLPDNIKQLKPARDIDTLNSLIEYISAQKEEFMPHPTLLKAFIYSKRPKRATDNIHKSVFNIFFQEYSYSSVNTLLEAHLIYYTIPPLKKVLNLPQFEGYHKYPVGLHSLRALYELEHIEDKFLKDIFNRLSKRRRALLKLVTLLHDCGKGRSRDHSIVGAELFGVYAKKIGLGSEEIKIGRELILYHTKMSIVAQKEDIHSEQTILKFASIFSTQEKLDLIYLLTYADMRAVKENVYNSITAKQLYDLYSFASMAIVYSDKLSEITKRVRKEKSLIKLEEFKSLPKVLQRRILSIPSDLLFIKYSPQKIIEIAKKSYKLTDYIYSIENSNYLIIEIIRKDNLDLSYLLSKLIRLELVNLDIFKLFDGVKYFKLEFTERVDEDEIIYIEHIIDRALNSVKELKLPSPYIPKDGIEINCNHSKEHAIMRVDCKKQKGILCYIMNIFDKFKIDITSSKIYTKVNRVSLLFLIEKNGNFCNNKDKIKREFTE